MNILLTGGAGFIGSALLERLVGAGHRVAVVDASIAKTIRSMRPPAAEADRPCPAPAPAGALP